MTYPRKLPIFLRVFLSSGEGLDLVNVSNLVKPILTSFATSVKSLGLFRVANNKYIILGDYYCEVIGALI